MPSLDHVTPVILTYNEEPNVGRTLERLGWAQRVVVVDSESEDRTPDIVRSFGNTDLHVRQFDRYASQWNYAVGNVETEWALAMDADYQMPPALVSEISTIPAETSCAGFFAAFDYVVLGRSLRSSLYPPRQVLFRTDRAVFGNDGHRQRVRVEGPSGKLHHRLMHDDRKPVDRWLANQATYARLEAQKLRAARWSELRWIDKLRRTRILGPPAVMAYCLIGKGLILDGWPGWYYTLERVTAEFILSMALIRSSPASEPTR